MSLTLDNSQLTSTIPTPAEGHIWLSIEDNTPVIITGVIHEDGGPEVHFSTLELSSYTADLGWFMENYSKRS